ncbi:hypothetical protein D3C86_1648260 [compost metagenome]
MKGFKLSQLYKPNQSHLVIANKEFTFGNLNFNVSKKIEGKVYFPTINLYNLKLYEYYNIFPQHFGKDLKNGIFQRKLTAEEKIELKKIIAETEELKP